MTLKLIIVVGNKLLSPQIHPELKGRMDIGIRVFKENSADYLILSGGKSNPDIKLAECEIMRVYAIENGIYPEKIILEPNAMDTIGNAYFTRKILDELTNCSDVYVISSCYHMKRVKFVFELCSKNYYNLNFNYCYPAKDSDAKSKEKGSIDMAKKFFENITPGDIEEIKKRLFTLHELYKQDASKN